ncbi:hypothetical protein GBF38_001036, partial [Nibea albiflora]
VTQTERQTLRFNFRPKSSLRQDSYRREHWEHWEHFKLLLNPQTEQEFDESKD